MRMLRRVRGRQMLGPRPCVGEGAGKNAGEGAGKDGRRLGIERDENRSSERSERVRESSSSGRSCCEESIFGRIVVVSQRAGGF